MQADFSPDINALKDKRYASDGIRYFKQEILERKLSKTFNEERPIEDFQIKDLAQVLSAAHAGEAFCFWMKFIYLSIDSPYEDVLKRSRTHDEDKKSIQSDSSLNEREPIGNS